MTMVADADQNDSERIAAEWVDGRGHLLAVATRVLGDNTDAEDVVQDAFTRLALQRVADIDDLRAWLVVVVRRLALDRVRSAHYRLSKPTDEADHVGVDLDADPVDRVTLDDEVQQALDVVLARLTPAQRTAFLLHDVFGVPFAQIGELVGRSPGACRQAATEARRAVRGQTGRPGVRDRGSAAELQALAGRFAAACRAGDLDALVSLLDPNVSGWATIDGRMVGFAEGARTVAERLLLFLGPSTGTQVTPLPIGDGVGVVATRRSEPFALIRLDVVDDQVRTMLGVVLKSRLRLRSLPGRVEE